MKFLFFVYQRIFSFFLVLFFGRGCRYIPSCSEYSKMAFEKYGILRGTFLSLARLSRCHPFSARSGYDPLP